MKKTIVISFIFILLTAFSAHGNDDAGQDMPDQAENIVYYTTNDYYNMESKGSLHILSHYKTLQQTNSYSCGPAAALMVLNHYGISGYSEGDIAQAAGTNPLTGTSVEGLKGFLEELGFQLDCHADTQPRFNDIQECEEYLIHAVDNNAPVLVEWVDWYGHWQTIIGIDTCGTESIYDDVLILADSYDLTDHCQDGYYIVPFARFFCMWRESPFTENEIPYEQPFITVYPCSEE